MEKWKDTPEGNEIKEICYKEDFVYITLFSLSYLLASSL